MLNEEWKPVKGYEDFYQISNLGNISNYRKVLKPFINNSGYQVIDLRVNGIRKKFLIHRLVAKHVIVNPQNLKVVNHKDGNKLNNSVDNLEWCTNSENILHARRTGLNPYNFPTRNKKLGKVSRYRGVGFDNSRNKWYSTVRVNGRNVEQKRFDSEEEAALWYNHLVNKYKLDKPKNSIYF